MFYLDYKSVAGSTDPYFANVVILLHYDALVGGKVPNFGYDTTPWSVIPTASISTTSPLYGAGNLLGVNGGVSPDATSANFPPGTGDYTLEIACATTSAASTMVLIDGVSFKPEILAQGGIFKFYNGSSVIASGGTVAADAKQVIAASRVSGVLYFLVDGALVGTVADTTNYTTNLWYAGFASNGTAGWIGRTDEFRVTIGVGRYTAAYTPDYTNPFPNS